MPNVATNPDPKHAARTALPAPSVVSADRLAEFAITAAEATLAAGGGLESLVLQRGGPRIQALSIDSLPQLEPQAVMGGG